jgi:hypothetical protein
MISLCSFWGKPEISLNQVVMIAEGVNTKPNEFAFWAVHFLKVMKNQQMH